MNPLPDDDAPATVLVVDDDATTRYVLGSWLRRAGHTVLEAADGTAGLELLELPGAPLPEAAIIDINLPDMSGFQLCAAIKADPRTAGVPVIHVSAVMLGADDHARGLQGGADAYLNQPIDRDELLATLIATLRYTRARQRAERLAVRLRTLNQTTLDVYRAVGFHSFAAAATGGAATLLSCPATAVFLTPQGQVVHSMAAGPGKPARLLPTHPGVLSRVSGQALGSGTGAEIADIPQPLWRTLVPSDHLKGDVSLLVARTQRGRPALCFAVPAEALSGPDDRELFQHLAVAGALALESLRSLAEEHSLALTLQKTFLPDRLPTVAGVEMAFRYVPAGAQAEIGGDFYEALETADGLLVAIGDVAGHSLAAATVMGEIRHALRAYALEGHPPHHIQDRLEILLAHSRPGVTVTLCLILVEPGGRRVRLSNAGHIPPLLVEPDGRARFLHEHGPLLGLGLPHPEPTVHHTAPGTRLVLVTDGLVEERSRNLDDSLGDFLEAVASGPADPEALSDMLLQAFGTEKDDDIALLALRLE
ncbi:fused response regulator/phosphatase [Streptomyces sp. NPDC001985]|uniref:fused response regulator/phosphatase n=1 Tax=Streptomyces sp. NPDC001985 TaxID=3154406 RepID=UPI00332CA616